MKMKSEKNVLVYLHSSDLLGDALLLMPIIPLLKMSFPDHRIIWLTGSGSGNSIFKTVLNPLIKEHIDEVIDDVTLGKKWSEWLSSCPIKQHMNVIIDTQNIIRNTLLLKRIPNSLFVSPAANFRLSDLKPAAGFKYPSSVQERLKTLIMIASGKNLSINYKLVLPEIYHDAAKELLPDDERYIGFAPGAGGKNKCWPLENYISLAKHQARLGRKPVFFIGPQEQEWCDPIKQAVPEALFPEQCVNADNVSGPLLCMALAQRVKVSIANDSGIGHMLVTAGCPLVSLFGPSNKQKFVSSLHKGIIIDATTYGGKDMSLIPILEVINAVNKLYENSRD